MWKVLALTSIVASGVLAGTRLDARAAAPPGDASASAGDAAAAGDVRVDRLTQKALLSDAHPSRGARLFKDYCARCHGARGLGDAARGTPAIAGQRFAYVVRQLANFRGEERDNATMHGILIQDDVRTPQAWADVAAFVNRLPYDASPQSGGGGRVELGRGIYAAQCASCHAADAGGDAQGFVPALRHQHYGYLVAQMHKLAAGHRHNVDEELVVFLRSFDDREIDATADYLSRLHGPADDRTQMRNDGVAVD